MQLALAVVILVADRLTKLLALAYCASEQVISPFVSCALTFNRGISWGMLHDANGTVFGMVTVLIACITGYIAYLGVQRSRVGDPAIGYVCVVAGSVSNLADRVIYGGVVDFISFSLSGWNFPVFNVADAFIVCGVMLIAWEAMVTDKND